MDGTGQWLRWQSAAAAHARRLAECLGRGRRCGRRTRATEAKKREVAITPLLDWQIFYFRSDAWTNPLSSDGTVAPNPAALAQGAPNASVPDGVRLVLTLPPGQALSGTLTRDWVRPTWAGTSHESTWPLGAQRGAALLMAMLTVTLVATFAAAAMWQQWRASEVEAAERARVQSGWVLVGALDWARLILREDAALGRRRPPGRALGGAAGRSAAVHLSGGGPEHTGGNATTAMTRKTHSYPARSIDPQSRLNVTNLVQNGQVSVRRSSPSSGFSACSGCRRRNSAC